MMIILLICISPSFGRHGIILYGKEPHCFDNLRIWIWSLFKEHSCFQHASHVKNPHRRTNNSAFIVIWYTYLFLILTWMFQMKHLPSFIFLLCYNSTFPFFTIAAVFSVHCVPWCQNTVKYVFSMCVTLWHWYLSTVHADLPTSEPLFSFSSGWTRLLGNSTMWFSSFLMEVLKEKYI